MEAQICSSIKGAFLRFLGEQVEVVAFDNLCIVTLPLRTVDDRYIDVFVETKVGDFALIHDGGKSTAELYAQGIHLTDTKEKLFAEMARRYGISFVDGTFTVGCRIEAINSAILAVAQCATLAMSDVLAHVPIAQDEPVLSRVGRALDAWKPPGIEIARRFPIKSKTPGANLFFDYAALARRPSHRNVGVKVLMPTYSPMFQAQRYGFLAHDVRETVFEDWPRLAIVAKADQWVEPAINLVRSFSTRTLEIESGNEDMIERRLPEYMEAIAA